MIVIVDDSSSVPGTAPRFDAASVTSILSGVRLYATCVTSNAQSLVLFTLYSRAAFLVASPSHHHPITLPLTPIPLPSRAKMLSLGSSTESRYFSKPNNSSNSNSSSNSSNNNYCDKASNIVSGVVVGLLRTTRLWPRAPAVQHTTPQQRQTPILFPATTTTTTTPTPL